MAERLHIKFTRAPYLIDVKMITERDWAGIGISHPTVIFDRSNRYMVDATDFPDAVVEYFREDSDFSLSTAENPKPPGPAALVARGPSGTDPKEQGFADEDDETGRNALEGQEDYGFGDNADRLAEARGTRTGPTTTVGGSGSD